VCEIRSKIVMAKTAFNNKKTFNQQTRHFSQSNRTLREHLVKCCIWSIALCGAGTWTLRKVDQKCGVREGWRISVGSIVWKVKKCHI